VPAGSGHATIAVLGVGHQVVLGSRDPDAAALRELATQTGARVTTLADAVSGAEQPVC
jgi:hypothetical protein